MLFIRVDSEFLSWNGDGEQKAPFVYITVSLVSTFFLCDFRGEAIVISFPPQELGLAKLLSSSRSA